MKKELYFKTMKTTEKKGHGVEGGSPTRGRRPPTTPRPALPKIEFPDNTTENFSILASMPIKKQLDLFPAVMFNLRLDPTLKAKLDGLAEVMKVSKHKTAILALQTGLTSLEIALKAPPMALEKMIDASLEEMVKTQKKAVSTAKQMKTKAERRQEIRINAAAHPGRGRGRPRKGSV
jgi:hypothetical protein